MYDFMRNKKTKKHFLKKSYETIFKKKLFEQSFCPEMRKTSKRVIVANKITRNDTLLPISGAYQND